MRSILSALTISAVGSITAAASNVTTLTPQHFPEYNSSRVLITYGPFLAPSSNVDMGMQDFLRGNITKPCSDCLITFMQAGLQYPNGTYANADTGMWLHHTVLYNQNASDAVCANSPAQRVWASGNERTPMDLTVNGTKKAGYYVNGTAELAMLVELMNERTDAREAVVTITYEYIPGIPQGFATVTPVWLDVGGCGSSDVAAFANTTFNYTSPAWASDISGEILGVGGHVHDGGTNAEVLQNGKVICDSVASYGLSPGYIEGSSPMMSMSTSMSMSMPSMTMDMPSMTMDMSSTSMDMPSMTMSMPGSPSSTDIGSMEMGMDTIHVSNMSFCADPGYLNKGDTLVVQAFYNTSEYAPMMGPNNTLEPVMGIALLYVANGVVSNVSSSTATATGSTSMLKAATGTTTATSTLLTGGAAAMNARAGIVAAIAAPLITWTFGF